MDLKLCIGRSYVISQNWHYWKIVDWDWKHQHKQKLIWVYTVCSGQSLHIFRVNLVPIFLQCWMRLTEYWTWGLLRQWMVYWKTFLQKDKHSCSQLHRLGKVCSDNEWYIREPSPRKANTLVLSYPDEVSFAQTMNGILETFLQKDKHSCYLLHRLGKVCSDNEWNTGKPSSRKTNTLVLSYTD